MRYVFILALAGLGWLVSPMLTFVIVLSMFDANVELAIEVDHYDPKPNTGWVFNLPCWKCMDPAKWYYRFWKLIMGRDKPMTGYHCWRIPTMLIFFHLPFFMGVAWSGRAEVLTWFWFLVQGIVEDYLWFFFHPCYGAKRFITKGRARKIWWMPDFWGPLPEYYWVSIPFLVGLWLLARNL